jgi:hypothetical protein
MGLAFMPDSNDLLGSLRPESLREAKVGILEVGPLHNCLKEGVE